MICSRTLSSGDSRWAIRGYINLIINLIECYNRRKHFILFVGTQRILILFNCHTSDNFFVDNAGPLTKQGSGRERGRGPYLSLNFSESTLPGCYCWKFAFVSFSEASKINLAPALPESRRGPCIRYLDFLINTVSSLFLQ